MYLRLEVHGEVELKGRRVGFCFGQQKSESASSYNIVVTLVEDIDDSLELFLSKSASQGG